MEKIMVLFVLIIILLVPGSNGSNKIPLYFSYITTKTGAFIASGAIPVVDLALEDINNHSDVLVNYTLNHSTNILDSNVSL